MSLSEIHRYLAELIRDGAGGIAALILGFVLGGLTVWRAIRVRGKRALMELQNENRELQAGQAAGQLEAARLTDKLQSCRDQYTRVVEAARSQWREYRGKLRDRLHFETLKSQRKLDRLRDTETKLRQSLTEQSRQCADLAHECETVREDLAQLREFTGRLESVVEERGKFWLRDVPADAPAFAPIRQRRPPIIALLNFKGGVGKTTLAANLAAVLARQRERVLAIDLDYQGSLTSLVMSNPDLRMAQSDQRLAQDLFLTGGGRGGELHRYVHTVSESFALMPATDPLADVETWLMARWLIQPQHGDARFILRAMLHDPRGIGEFDRILIDCPPRLTTACINALACCDYVLVPVILDRTSTLAAPRLLGLLHELQPTLMPALGGIGLVANRIGRIEMTAGECDLWSELADQCRDAWGRPVDQLATAVPQRVSFRDAANRHRLAANDNEEVREVFTRLAGELIERVPRESRRAPSVHR